MSILSILQSVGALCFLFSLTVHPLVWIIIGPYYDKIFKDICDPTQNYALFFPRLWRATTYSLMLVFGYGTKRSIYKLIYHDYNFCNDSRLRDRIIAYLVWVPIIIMLICFLLIIALNLFSQARVG